MSMLGYLQYERVNALLAILFVCSHCESHIDITTLSTQDTNTRFVGTAYVTEFASHEFATAKFLGIPYAKTPQRFAKPVLNTPNSGELHAKTFGNICPQVISRGDACQIGTMSEDCLFLNIYVPLRHISDHRLGELVKNTHTRSKSPSTLPTVTGHHVNGTPQVPSKSTDNILEPISFNADSESMSASRVSSNGSSHSEVTISSVQSILNQIELLEKTLISDLKSENGSKKILNTQSVTGTRSASPVSAHDKPLVLPGNTKYAVLVYLHGGAYVMGSGNCYDGSVLTGHGNIIVVTVNYRLGNLGFLSTHDDVIPGNLGLWDQHIAVQWVKKYIHVFGGDPDRITLGGQSAGSYSSIYQALYQGNDGLFQRVLAQSGTPTARKSASVTGYNTTLKVAKQLNCNIQGTKQEMKSCLMSVSAESLVNVSLPMLVPGSLPIQPTVEEPFVPEDPYKILSQMVTPAARNPQAVPEYFKRKDLLIGIDAQDGDVAWYLRAVLNSRSDSSKLMELIQSTIDQTLFKGLVRTYFQHDFNDTVDEYMLSSVIDRYIDWENPKNLVSQSNRAIDFLTDVFFAIPVMDTASAHCNSRDHSLKNKHETTTKTEQLGHKPTESPVTPGGTFVYRFNLPERQDGAIPWFRGTGHASEIKYVFGQVRPQRTSDVALSKIIMTYWSNFVKSGNPNRDSPVDAARTPATTDALPMWREYDNDEEHFMELSENPQTKSRMRANYRHFWTQYLPELKQHMKDVYDEGARSTIAVSRLHHQPSSGQAMPESTMVAWVVVAGIGMALMVI